MTLQPRAGCTLGHAHDGQVFAVGKGDSDEFCFDPAFLLVERYAGEGGAHFEFAETGCCCGVFAGFQDESADALAGEIGMDEDGADAGGIGGGVEVGIFADRAVVAAEESLAHAPAAAAGEAAIEGFHDEVGVVGDETGVEAENGSEGAFDLGGSVVARLEDADGGFDEVVESGDVCRGGETDGQGTQATFFRPLAAGRWPLASVNGLSPVRTSRRSLEISLRRIWTARRRMPKPPLFWIQCFWDLG